MKLSLPRISLRFVSYQNPNSAKADDSTIGSDLEDDEEWNSEKDGKDKDEDTEEDLVSFLLSNVMPKPKRSASSKKQVPSPVAHLPR